MSSLLPNSHNRYELGNEPIDTPQNIEALVELDKILAQNTNKNQKFASVEIVFKNGTNPIMMEACTISIYSGFLVVENDRRQEMLPIETVDRISCKKVINVE